MSTKRLIDANEIIKKAVPHIKGEHGYSANIRNWAVLVGDIQDAPTIDAVEVVRCRDCKHFTDGMAIGMCKRNPEKPIIPMPYNAYCAFGKRKSTT